ncbi:MAG: hypothetical protein JJT78_02960 [Leptospira sp.]|nr:hypothetical protein [Leptospira sp.]
MSSSFIKFLVSISAFLFFSGLGSDVVRKDFFQSAVNWSRYEIQLNTEVNVPRIQIHDELNHFSGQTATNLSEARSIAYSNAHKKNRSRMNIAMEKLLFDENYTLGEYMEENPKYKSKIIHYFNENPEKETIVYEKNKLVLESRLNLLGSQELISVFFPELGGEVLPEIHDDLPSDSFTGLIIDARGTSFRPSLFPKIQNQEGRDIFSRKIANPNSILELGLVSYMENSNHPSVARRVGRNPYLVNPMSVVGKNLTNLVLANEEIAKIISSPSNRKNLRLCKVVILVGELDR